MKNVLLAIVAIALFGYLGWHWFAPAPKPPPPVARPQAQRTPAKPATAARPTPAKVQVAKPTPARSVATRQPRPAPEGTYFLLQRVSLKIDSGVVGFAPGTKVTMVQQGPQLSTVSDGQYQFGVVSSQLTNDLNIAEDVAKSDYANQAQIAAGIGQSVRWYEQQQRDAIAAEEKEKAEKKKGQKTPAHKSPSPAPR
ncbi:MAG: hypothetical protein DME50_17580 [Verrucomicrobia bacterium]|nr:MAG: hypothetical protein DME50_17580 [Verrucomicrobiota bacterium]